MRCCFCFCRSQDTPWVDSALHARHHLRRAGENQNQFLGKRGVTSSQGPCVGPFLSWELGMRQLWGRGAEGHREPLGADPLPPAPELPGSQRGPHPPGLCTPPQSASCAEPPGWLGTPWARPTLRPLSCLNPLRGWWTRSREKEFTHSRQFYHF